MFTLTNPNAFLSKPKNIFWIFCCISRIYIKFGILWKRRWASEVISFWFYRFENMALLTCLKSLVSEHLWMVNMLKGPKDCLNLNGSIFVIFFDHSERKSAQKIMFLWYLKSRDCLLRYWHPMKSILSQ